MRIKTMSDCYYDNPSQDCDCGKCVRLRESISAERLAYRRLGFEPVGKKKAIGWFSSYVQKSNTYVATELVAERKAGDEINFKYYLRVGLYSDEINDFVYQGRFKPTPFLDSWGLNEWSAHTLERLLGNQVKNAFKRSTPLGSRLDKQSVDNYICELSAALMEGKLTCQRGVRRFYWEPVNLSQHNSRFKWSYTPTSGDEAAAKLKNAHYRVHGFALDGEL